MPRNQILEQPKQHSISFEDAQWAELSKIAKEQKVSINEIIRRACEKFTTQKQSRTSAS